MLDISKMLTVSTVHITNKTASKLGFDEFEDIPVFEKGEFGWLVCALCIDYLDDAENQIPADLFAAMMLARSNDCEWLCLDHDGEIVDELKVFDWDI